MAKCNCYRETDRYRPYANGECLGTKEIDPCICGGYELHCDFYPHIRERAKQKQTSKIIAVDFDGTLCTNKWPDIGEPNNEVINYLLSQKAEGTKIILWTCRSDEELITAVNWCGQLGLEFDAVNKNLPEIVELFGKDTRKIYADEYIDDRMSTKFKF